MSDAEAKVETSSIKVLFPGREIKVGDEAITVKPFYFGQYQKAIALLEPLIASLNVSGLVVPNARGGINLMFPEDWPVRLAHLIATGGEPLYAFIGFAVKKPREWFDTVEGDEGFELTKAVFAENASFFEKRIAPMFAELVKSNGSDPTGEALSPDLSAPVSQETKLIDQPSIN